MLSPVGSRKRTLSVQLERFGELSERVGNFENLFRLHAYQRNYVDDTGRIERKHLLSSLN